MPANGAAGRALSTAYRGAFTKGGWVIVQKSPGAIRAHYAKNGRNIWAMVWDF